MKLLYYLCMQQDFNAKAIFNAFRKIENPETNSEHTYVIEYVQEYQLNDYWWKISMEWCM